jgi:4,5-dihydroxyphthalate decarboxylase
VSVNIDIVSDRLKTKSDRKTITLAMADYDRTRPLIDGRVTAGGLTLKTNTSWIGDFCVRPVYEEYDAAEMSLSWYVMARLRDEPVVALPVFPLRMPVLAYVFVREDSPITRPSDLKGKRVATIIYRITVNLWLRGIFQEHYGLSPNDLTWVITGGEEGAGFNMPRGVQLTKQTGATPEELLARGEVDAIFLPELAEGFVAGETKFRRLFPDTQAEMQSFVRRTGQLPITHTIVMNKKLADREPAIARSLTKAFVDAQDVCDNYWSANPKHLSLPDGVFFLEQQRAAYGPKPYVHGLEPNRKVLETFVRYAHEQGYIQRLPALEELFPAFGA